ncbi:MAG: RNA polymerase sigma-70 factor [Bacteroides sp.]|nr:RNA polymerase sigma-70 factor [Bacteroides sp.]
MTKITPLDSMQAFSSFFLENQEKFLSFACSYTRDRAEAEDILMESMITLWENRERWQEGSNLHGLLLTIVKNKCLNYLQHEQIKFRAQENINEHRQRELSLRISTLEACEPDSLFNNEIQLLLSKALKKLPSQSRKIFILSRQENTPNKKIAEQLGVSVKTVEFHITKTLKFLRQELKDYLVSILF